MASAPRRTKSFGYSNRGRGNFDPGMNLMVELVGPIVRAPGGGAIGVPFTEDLAKKGAESGKVTYDHARVRFLNDIPKFDVKKGTEVELVMPLPKAYQDGTKEFRGRNLARLDTPVSGGEAMRSGAKFALQNAWMKNDRLFAHYGAGGPNAPALELGSAAVLPNVLATVLKPATREDGSEYQQVMVVKGDQAKTVESGDGILTAYEEAFPDGADLKEGNPGFVLIARARAPEGMDAAEQEAFYNDPSNRISLRQAVYAEKQEGTDEYVQPTGYDAIQKFLEREDKAAQAFFPLIESQDWDVQFVPLLTVSQSPNRLPSKSERGTDFSQDYIGYEESENDPAVMEVWDPIFTPSDIVVMRMVNFYDNDGNQLRCTASGNILDDEGCKTAEKAPHHKFGVPFSTYQNPIERGAPTGYYLSDIPTAGMPEAHLKAVLAEGERLKQNGIKARKAINAERYSNTEETAEPENNSPRP
ncbi:hypothetical protein AD929_04305 [Gluconobacter potus]|uniref:Uncharacterized protein n=1 Tax=Gluconobacter potus TaxID=2724927 RepID=A0A149QXJ7_9PROT|nr:hypothetical protein [Gluconobacter potus]KXV02032.1 hypothetical protein AD929_04305 [Gluconobacter potus]